MAWEATAASWQDLWCCLRHVWRNWEPTEDPNEFWCSRCRCFRTPKG